jgi:lysophospholipase L1-like esterase
LLLAVCSLLVGLGLLEGALRLAGFVHMPALVPMMIWNPVEDAALRKGEGLFQPDTTQLWVPRPGAVPPWAPEETINPAGYRGELLEAQPREGVLRIATLGDSSTFGLEVGADQTWSAQLALELIGRGMPTEVLNAGVVGHTIRQGIERYKALVRDYRPQIVIAAFGAVNDHIMSRDMADAEKIARRVAYSRWDALRDGARLHVRILHLVGFLVEKLRGLDRRQLREEFRALRKEMRALEKEMGKVDWPGTRRVSVEDFSKSLAELDDMVRADGARLVLVSMFRHPDKEAESPVLLLYNRAVERVASERNLPFFDVRDMMDKQFFIGRTWDDMFIDHYHPSVRGHTVIAKGLAELLRKTL